MNFLKKIYEKVIPQKVRNLDLSKTEDKLKLLILVSGLGIFALIGSATAIQLTMFPKFCSTCHIMAPEYATWKATAHNELKCTACHIKPGLLNLIEHKVGAMKEVYLYVTKTYPNPIESEHPIENEVCQQCHSQKRRVTPSGDLIIPHDRHENKQVLCVACHSGVAHGNIARREVNKDVKRVEWTDERGALETAKKYTLPKMETCIKCHTQRKVSTLCTKCHSKIQVPGDHKNFGWKSNHGMTAMGDIMYCQKCHSYGFEDKEGDIPKKGIGFAEYARKNTFCRECHSKRPHDANFITSHMKREKAIGRDACYACHDLIAPSEITPTQTYCNKCHWFKPNNTLNFKVSSSSKEE